MNHEICHCEGVNCELRDICKRYIAHLDVNGREDNKKRYSYLEPSKVGNECEAFWRSHE